MSSENQLLALAATSADESLRWLVRVRTQDSKKAFQFMRCGHIGTQDRRLRRRASGRLLPYEGLLSEISLNRVHQKNADAGGSNNRNDNL